MIQPDHRKLSVKFLFEGQLQHLMLLILLVSGTIFLASPVLGDGVWMELSNTNWLVAVITVSIIHQISGWFVFRFQLVYSLFSRLFGKHDLLIWGILFFPMLILRVLLTLGLGLADFGSMGDFRTLQIILAGVLIIPFGFTIWSIGRYLGVARALGGDHFREAYRGMPLVKEGAFKFSTNAIYTFGFFNFLDHRFIDRIPGCAGCCVISTRLYLGAHVLY